MLVMKGSDKFPLRSLMFLLIFVGSVSHTYLKTEYATYHWNIVQIFLLHFDDGFCGLLRQTNLPQWASLRTFSECSFIGYGKQVSSASFENCAALSLLERVILCRCACHVLVGRAQGCEASYLIKFRAQFRIIYFPWLR